MKRLIHNQHHLKPSKNTTFLARVANRHVSLEVTPDQYNVVGENLLVALEVISIIFLSLH